MEYLNYANGMCIHLAPWMHRHCYYHTLIKSGSLKDFDIICKHLNFVHWWICPHLIYFNIVDGGPCFQVECIVFNSNCIRKIKGIIAEIENPDIKRCKMLTFNIQHGSLCLMCTVHNVYTTIIHLFVINYSLEWLWSVLSVFFNWIASAFFTSHYTATIFNLQPKNEKKKKRWNNNNNNKALFSTWTRPSTVARTMR